MSSASLSCGMASHELWRPICLIQGVVALAIWQDLELVNVAR